MSKETQPKNSLTIEQVASFATENVLRDGGHIPTLMAEGSQKNIVVQFETFGKSSVERRQLMIKMGFHLARDPQFGFLQQAFLITEGWMSLSPLDKPPTVPPSEDPGRKEVLIIQGLALDNYQVSAAIFEMIRDNKGELRELKAFESFPDPSMSAESPLLQALFLGFALGLSDKRVE